METLYDRFESFGITGACAENALYLKLLAQRFGFEVVSTLSAGDGHALLLVDGVVKGKKKTFLMDPLDNAMLKDKRGNAKDYWEALRELHKRDHSDVFMTPCKHHFTGRPIMVNPDEWYQVSGSQEILENGPYAYYHNVAYSGDSDFPVILLLKSHDAYRFLHSNEDSFMDALAQHGLPRNIAYYFMLNVDVEAPEHKEKLEKIERSLKIPVKKQ